MSASVLREVSVCLRRSTQRWWGKDAKRSLAGGHRSAGGARPKTVVYAASVEAYCASYACLRLLRLRLDRDAAPARASP